MNLKTWNGMTPAKQKAFQAAADKAIAWSAAEHLKREAELADGFKKQGLEVYAPDVNAFRAHAQKVYLASDEAKEWPQGHAREDQRDEVATCAAHRRSAARRARVAAALASPIRRESMHPSMRAVDWLRRRAENVVAGLLGVMFVAFIIQIVFRYFFNFPIGWTSELTVIAWL